jgi:hypothetical protein
VRGEPHFGAVPVLPRDMENQKSVSNDLGYEEIDWIEPSPRTQEEIDKAAESLRNIVWYDRQTHHMNEITEGTHKCTPEQWEVMERAISWFRLEHDTESGELGPFTDFEWGMINGKLSALRWVSGNEWDMLDT